MRARSCTQRCAATKLLPASPGLPVQQRDLDGARALRVLGAVLVAGEVAALGVHERRHVLVDAKVLAELGDDLARAVQDLAGVAAGEEQPERALRRREGAARSAQRRERAQLVEVQPGRAQQRVAEADDDAVARRAGPARAPAPRAPARRARAPASGSGRPAAAATGSTDCAPCIVRTLHRHRAGAARHSAMPESGADEEAHHLLRPR